MTAIIKPVGVSCNLKCDYCFFNGYEQSSEKVMSYQILDIFITEYLNLFDREIQFIWHGGEPLLAGINFYQTAINIQQLKCRQEHKIQNLIQTNGTLITDEWADFFRINNFKVGISLDGIVQCHNQFRKNSLGIGSFKKVIKSIEILRNHEIEPGIIQTIPKSSLKYIKENFIFLTETLGLKKIGINIFNDIENINPKMNGESLSNDDYFDLYKNYFDFWLEKDDPKLIIREIESFMYGILGKCSNSCAYSGTCTSFMTVDWDGNVIPACERLLPISSNIGKNIKTNHLIDILNNSKRIEFTSRVNTLPADCQVCDWLSACYNGCTSHRIGGINGKYAYCEGQKKVFSYFNKKLETI
jgi:uncharacterized protein